MKVGFVVLGLALVCLFVSTNSQVLPPVGNLTVANVYPFVDYQLRERYWYYLTKAFLLFRADLAIGDSFQFLSVYRNLVGTFLSVTTWKQQTTQIEVNTLVRLGNGYEQGSGANYSPFNINSKQFKFLLGNGEYFVQVDQTGNVAVNGNVLGSGNATSTTSKSELDTACGVVDTYVRNRFWFYLDKAQNVYQSNSMTNKKYYCLINYVNIVGTFFFLGSYDPITKIPSVNTFVRLGDGYEQNSGANYPPVKFEKVILNLTNISE